MLDYIICILNHAITILLIGKTGAGKSSLGNALLGWKDAEDPNAPFQVSAGTHSATSEMSMVGGYFFGNTSRPIQVIDTPGFGASSGLNNQFSNKLKRIMIQAGHINVLLWCRNGTENRIDQDELNQVTTCEQIFGSDALNNMVMNLCKWRHSEIAENDRKRTGQSLAKFKNKIWETVSSRTTINQRFPILALDVMYDVKNTTEESEFNDIREDMWRHFRYLESTPLFTKEVLLEQQARNKADEQRKHWTAMNSAFSNTMQEFERQEKRRRQDEELDQRQSFRSSFFQQQERTRAEPDMNNQLPSARQEGPENFSFRTGNRVVMGVRRTTLFE